MTLAPKRRWSYSLRTLFVVVTVFACWLGYELNWIRQRQQFIDSDEAEPGPITADAYGGWPDAPLMLRLFGVEGYALICINFSPDETINDLAIASWRVTKRQQQAVKRLRQLFPEAEAIEGGVTNEKNEWHRLILDVNLQ